MICEKCGGKVRSNMKCSLCGHDNSNVDYAPVTSSDISSLRSGRITIFMYLVIILDAVVVITSLYALLTKVVPTAGFVIAVILISLSVLEIIVCLFILKMKKWALFTYIGLSVVGAILQLLSLNIIPIIFKALLLYFIFKNDWEYFD